MELTLAVFLWTGVGRLRFPEQLRSACADQREKPPEKNQDDLINLTNILAYMRGDYNPFLLYRSL